MEKVPDYKRIVEVLRRGGQPTNNDRVWINYYLELADKYLSLSDHIPAEKVPRNKRNDEKPATRAKMALRAKAAAAGGNAESADEKSADVESEPSQAKKQSA